MRALVRPSEFSFADAPFLTSQLVRSVAHEQYQIYEFFVSMFHTTDQAQYDAFRELLRLEPVG